jgi:hypothetical protein
MGIFKYKTNMGTRKVQKANLLDLAIFGGENRKKNFLKIKTLKVRF